MEWQPIETAPRDGTEILGYGRGYFWIVHWDRQHWSDYDPITPPEPTHWMSLPEPPK